MNNQEAFEKSSKFLLKQDRKSLIDTGDCAYRGPMGLQCAIGCLIPDKEYDPNMEDYSVDQIIRKTVLPSLAGIDVSLLVDLQEVHDYRKIKDWPKYFLLIGEKHKLDITFLTQ